MGKTTYYLIRNRDDFGSLKSLAGSKSFDAANSIAVLWDSAHAPSIKELSMKFALIDDFAKKVDFNSVRQNVHELTKSFPHKKVLHNKSLAELLEYDGCSLWWFIRQGFYSHCLRVLRDVKTIQVLAKKRDLKKIVVFGRDEEFAAAVKEAAGKTKVEIREVYNNDIAKGMRNAVSGLLPKLIRVIQGFNGVMRISGKKPRILVFTRAHKWSTVAKGIRGDSDSYTIVKSLSSKNWNVIQLDVAINREAAWNAIEKKKPCLPYDFFLFRSFFDPGIALKIHSLKSRLGIVWKGLDSSRHFRQALDCGGISLYPILRERIKSYFFSDFDSLAGAARNLEVGRNMIKEMGIDLVLCVDENGTGRFVVFASKLEGVKCIALQHGTIGEMSIAYNYSKKDLSGKLGCKLPDKTAVFGDYYRDLLMDTGNYGRDSIAVTGQPKTDMFLENRKKYSKKALCGRLGIDPGKKIVVFASQPIKEEESKANFTALAVALKKIKNAELVVKLHPNDKEGIYRNIAAELGYKCTITKDADLYELLFCSDIVASIYSTVMLEALIMGKPVIQLNLLEKYDLFPKSKNEFIIRITKESGLYSTIQSLLSGSTKFKSLEKARKKFIFEHYNHVDGNATERVVKVLESILK